MAKPKRIILVRHGESEANKDKGMRAVKSDHRMELTANGHAQAKEAGLAIKELVGDGTVRAYVSPYFRTRQTYAGIASTGLNVVRMSEDPRIREQDFGHLRDKEAFELIDAERSAYGTFFYRIPDGESGADVYDRISSFLNSLWRDFDKTDYPENTLIVSHGLTIRLFCMRWFHWDVEQFEKLRNPFNCERYVLELEPPPVPVGGYFTPSQLKYKLTTPFREYTAEETESWKRASATTVMGGSKPWMP